MHLGHYVGSLNQRVALQVIHEQTILVALLKRKMEHLFCFCNPTSDAAVTRYEKLSGEVVFKHQIRVLSQKGRAISSTAVLRFIVLENNRSFHVIQQVRGGLTPEQLKKGLYYEVFHSVSALKSASINLTYPASH